MVGAQTATDLSIKTQALTDLSISTQALTDLSIKTQAAVLDCFSFSCSGIVQGVVLVTPLCNPLCQLYTYTCPHKLICPYNKCM